MQRYPTPDLGRKARVLDRRAEALVVDVALGVVVLFVLGYLISSLFGHGRGIAGGIGMVKIGVFPVTVLYQTVFEGYYGATIGKHLRDIVVVQSNGSRITPGSAMARNLLRIVDGLPTFYLLGTVVASLTDEHQRIGDLAADTVVVHTAE